MMASPANPLSFPLPLSLDIVVLMSSGQQLPVSEPTRLEGPVPGRRRRGQHNVTGG